MCDELKQPLEHNHHLEKVMIVIKHCLDLDVELVSFQRHAVVSVGFIRLRSQYSSMA
jgi:hypothetical protein